ncbi:alpha/beta fold hydrolase [Burkholderia pseudomultivorans]|uniref:Alpha/beta hydrolase fold family protein n=2 Tax=Burkholderia cepacia complex TaxID=87882 RepID=A0AAN0RV52_9BURK|nr:alpha/beta fold hydrolase [Burkholderia pseudomultivorans]AIO34478.1 alpha/beta hydrolase fold family protein [Burkholderia cenocepacia]KWF62763.1 alpha/beta hydrolase [Burkholderia pseudomultivorans]
MTVPSQLLFLPGASGSTAFWQPLATRLTHPAARRIVGYPGFGDTPHDPAVDDFDSLVRHVLATIDRPTAVIAQSMGGVIAMRAALERPELVTQLVLTVTSGGLDMRGLGAQDWRAGFADANPQLPDWFLTFHADLSQEIGRIAQPTLLLWGDDDPLSPVAAGRRLLERLPDARLHVVPGGRHDLAAVHADALAPLVDAHLPRA